MIYQLMKRDLSWRIAAFSSVLAILATLATTAGSPLSALITLTPILFLAALARPHHRATLFQAGLPVSARDLFLARLLCLLATVWHPLAVYSAVGSNWSVRTLEWAVLLALLVLLPLATRATELDCPAWVAPLEWLPGLAIGAAALYFLPPAACLAFGILAFSALFLRTWATLPPAFTCAPREAAVWRPDRRSSNAPAPAWWTLTRQMLPWFTLLYVPLVAAQTMLGNILFAGCFCVSLYSQIRTRARLIQALPIQRRTFLLFALVPSLLPIITGAVFVSGRTNEVSIYYSEGRADVRFPVELWRHAPAGVTPVVESPWAETYRPVPERFLGYPLYNPYSVGAQSSPRFLQWQKQRAQNAVNAQPLTSIRLRILYVAATSALALGAAWLVELLYSFRFARLSSATRSSVSLAIFVPLFSIPLILDVSHIGHGSGSASAALLRGVVWRTAGRLPENLAVLLAIAILPVLFLLWLLDRQIRESEGVDAPSLKPR